MTDQENRQAPQTSQGGHSRIPVNQNNLANMLGTPNPGPPAPANNAAAANNGNRDQDQFRGFGPLEQGINSIAKVPFPVLVNENQIELWFDQLRAWFDLNNVRSDNTKYNMVIAHLRPDVLGQVEHLVRTPPVNDKFETIKAAIISRFADSERTRVHKLVSGITLGDKKPSYLLQELRRANVGDDERILKTLWIQRLPTQAQATVSIAHGTLDEVVVETLRIGSQSYGVSQVQRAEVSHCHEAEGGGIQSQMDEIKKMVAELRMERNQRGRSRSRGGGSRRGKTPSGEKEYDFCWYHYKFGMNAKKCGRQSNPPKNCKFNQKN